MVTITMELSLLALQAVKIALHATDKATGGALEKAGANVLDFLTKRFQDQLQVKKSESKLLEAAIVSKAESDQKFQEDLEKLVVHYHQVQSSNHVSQNTETGVNINVPNNSGNVVGQQIGSQFRS